MKQTVGYKNVLQIEGRAFANGTAHNAFSICQDPGVHIDDNAHASKTANNHTGHDRRHLADKRAQWDFGALRAAWSLPVFKRR